jgi:predicted ATPase
MGIKFTTQLTRAEAIALYYELRAKLDGEHEVEMTDHELGNKLDELAEEWADRNNTTCFDNYQVVDHTDYDYKNY